MVASLYLFFLIFPISIAYPAWDDEAKLVAGPNRVNSSKRTGRPGELTPAEQTRINQIIDRFILHDIGVTRDPLAVREFKDLGPEAIPFLVRGFNKAITLNHSCPATMIYHKLSALIRICEDRQVLAFIRTEVGAGVPATPYAGLVNNLKVLSSMRSAYLARTQAEPPRSPHPGGKSPGDLDPQ
jgi:hypothetical protein